MSKFRVCRIIKPDSILNNMIISKEPVKSEYPETLTENSTEGFKVGDYIWVEYPYTPNNNSILKYVEGSGKSTTKFPIYAKSYDSVDSLLIPYETYRNKIKEVGSNGNISNALISLGKRFALFKLTNTGWELVINFEDGGEFFGYISNRENGVLSVASYASNYAPAIIQFVLTPKSQFDKVTTINSISELRDKFLELLRSRNIDINNVNIREPHRLNYLVPAPDTEALSTNDKGDARGSYILASYGAEYTEQYGELSVFGIERGEPYILDSGYNQ